MSKVVHVSASATDTGRRRQRNEDSVLVLPEAGIFAVADGMGGAAGGDMASALVATRLRETLVSHREEPEPTPRSFADTVGLVRAAVNRANTEILELARQSGSRGMGTTVVLLSLPFDSVEGSGWSFHAGDSRLYGFRDGTLRQITRDHSGAAEFPNEESVPAFLRGVVTRAVGLQPTVDLECTAVPFRPGDLFLLCSDGLTGMLSDAVIEQQLRETTPDTLEATVNKLVVLANEAGGADNISVVLVRIVQGEAQNAAVLAPASSGEPSTAVTQDTDVVGETPVTGGTTPIAVQKLPVIVRVRGLFGRLPHRAVAAGLAAAVAVGAGVAAMAARGCRRDLPAEDRIGMPAEDPPPAQSSAPIIGEVLPESDPSFTRLRRALGRHVSETVESGAWGQLAEQVHPWLDQVEALWAEASDVREPAEEWFALWHEAESADESDGVARRAEDESWRRFAEALAGDTANWPAPADLGRGRGPIFADAYCRYVWQRQTRWLTHAAAHAERRMADPMRRDHNPAGNDLAEWPDLAAFLGDEATGAWVHGAASFLGRTQADWQALSDQWRVARRRLAPLRMPPAGAGAQDLLREERHWVAGLAEWAGRLKAMDRPGDSGRWPAELGLRWEEVQRHAAALERDALEWPDTFPSMAVLAAAMQGFLSAQTDFQNREAAAVRALRATWPDRLERAFESGAWGEIAEALSLAAVFGDDLWQTAPARRNAAAEWIELWEAARGADDDWMAERHAEDAQWRMFAMALGADLGMTDALPFPSLAEGRGVVFANAYCRYVRERQRSVIAQAFEQAERRLQSPLRVAPGIRGEGSGLFALAVFLGEPEAEWVEDTHTRMVASRVQWEALRSVWSVVPDGPLSVAPQMDALMQRIDEDARMIAHVFEPYGPWSRVDGRCAALLNMRRLMQNEAIQNTVRKIRDETRIGYTVGRVPDHAWIASRLREMQDFDRARRSAQGVAE